MKSSDRLSWHLPLSLTLPTSLNSQAPSTLVRISSSSSSSSSTSSSEQLQVRSSDRHSPLYPLAGSLVCDTTKIFQRSLSPRKRSVTCDDCPTSTYKRARVGRIPDTSYMDPNALPSPSPTPDRSRPIEDTYFPSHKPTSSSSRPTLRALLQLPAMLKTFDSLTPTQRDSVYLEILKRSTLDSLQLVNGLILPVLKRDFLASLPHELGLNIIRRLDAPSLCRAACVTRQWRRLIDGDSQTWLMLLTQDGYSADVTSPSITFSKTHFPFHPFKAIYRHHSIMERNWELGRAKRTVFIGHPTHVVTCLQFDDDKIISGADDYLINIYETSTGRLLNSLTGHEGGVWALEYVGNTIVSGSTDRTIRVWDIARGVCTHVFAGHTSTVRCLQIIQPTLVNGRMEPSQPLIVTGSRDSTLRVWRLPQEGEPEYHGVGPNPWFMHTLTGHSQSVRAIAAHGNILVSGSYDNTVGVWNVQTGQLLHRMEGHTQKVYSVVIDPQHNRCMSGSMDNFVRIWDLNTGECLRILGGHTILVGLLGLTDQHLVSAAADATLRIWAPDSGVCEHVLSGHQGAITCFQHDDTKVISGSEGGLKMWDIRTGRHMADLITDVSSVWRVAFNERRCVAAVQKM
ncbi:WD40-repeat-containing domain protein [Phycomyces nitens]|nr:WD40-repeat-containing domain protein [Phycomyces nitens]